MQLDLFTIEINSNYFLDGRIVIKVEDKLDNSLALHPKVVSKLHQRSLNQLRVQGWASQVLGKHEYYSL
jgi:hypothetical protein